MAALGISPRMKDHVHLPADSIASTSGNHGRNSTTNSSNDDDDSSSSSSSHQINPPEPQPSITMGPQQQQQQQQQQARGRRRPRGDRGAAASSSSASLSPHRSSGSRHSSSSAHSNSGSGSSRNNEKGGGSKSKSPVRTRSAGSGDKSNDNSKGNMASMLRHRSFSPIRLLRGAIANHQNNKKQNNHNPKDNLLHIVPEAMNESSSGSLHFTTSSAAFRQEQMIQAFATMSSKFGDSSIVVLEDPEDVNLTGGEGPPQQIQVQQTKTRRSSSSSIRTKPKRRSNPSVTVPDNIQLDTTINSVDSLPTKIDETEREQHDASDHDDDYYDDNDVDLVDQEASTTRHPPKHRASLDEYLIRETPSPHARTSSGGRRSSYTRHSATSSTLASGVSVLSYNSMTSFNSTSSMPSLSSIMEHDLQSVATNGTGGNSTVYTGASSIASTSWTGSGDLPSLSGMSAATNSNHNNNNNGGVVATCFNEQPIIATGSNEQPIILSLDPPPGEARKLMNPSFSSSSNSSSGVTNSRSSLRRMVPILSDPSTPIPTPAFPNSSNQVLLLNNNSSKNEMITTTSHLHQELYYLAGTTLDELGPNIQNPHKNVPQERWESDVTTKKKASPAPSPPTTTNLATVAVAAAATAADTSSNPAAVTSTSDSSNSDTINGEPSSDDTIAHGNRDVAPLTHEQKNMLPTLKRAADVQPIYVARRDSDASNCANSIATLLQQQAGGVDEGLGNLLEHSPVPNSICHRPTIGEKIQEAFASFSSGSSSSPNNHQHHNRPSTQGDTLPTMARRLSSTSTMTPLILGSSHESLMEIPILSPPNTDSGRIDDSGHLGEAQTSTSRTATNSTTDTSGVLSTTARRGPRGRPPDTSSSRGTMPRISSSDSLSLPPQPSRPVSPPL